MLKHGLVIKCVERERSSFVSELWPKEQYILPIWRTTIGLANRWGFDYLLFVATRSIIVVFH